MAAPAFQFYAKDWIINTRELGPYGRGVYIDMLALCWEAGSIADDLFVVAESVGADHAILSQPRFNRGSTAVPTGAQPHGQPDSLWSLLRAKFATDPGQPGRLFHVRLEVEREKQAEFSEKQRAKGLASATARARAKIEGRFNRNDATADPTAVQPRLNRGATARSTGSQPEANLAFASAFALKEELAPAAPPLASDPLTLSAPATPAAEKPAPKPRTSHFCTREQAVEAIAATAAGRFVACKPDKGGAFKVDLLRRRPDVLDACRLVGRWLAAGGDAWRGTLDGRALGSNLDGWIAQSEAWERAGSPPIAANGRSGALPPPAAPASVVIRLPKGIA